MGSTGGMEERGTGSPTGSSSQGFGLWGLGDGSRLHTANLKYVQYRLMLSLQSTSLRYTLYIRYLTLAPLRNRIFTFAFRVPTFLSSLLLRRVLNLKHQYLIFWQLGSAEKNISRLHLVPYRLLASSERCRANSFQPLLACSTAGRCYGTHTLAPCIFLSCNTELAG